MEPVRGDWQPDGLGAVARKNMVVEMKGDDKPRVIPAYNGVGMHPYIVVTEAEKAKIEAMQTFKDKRRRFPQHPNAIPPKERIEANMGPQGYLDRGDVYFSPEA